MWFTKVMYDENLFLLIYRAVSLLLMEYVSMRFIKIIKTIFRTGYIKRKILVAIMC